MRKGKILTKSKKMVLRNKIDNSIDYITLIKQVFYYREEEIELEMPVDSIEFRRHFLGRGMSEPTYRSILRMDYKKYESANKEINIYYKTIWPLTHPIETLQQQNQF